MSSSLLQRVPRGIAVCTTLLVTSFAACSDDVPYPLIWDGTGIFVRVSPPSAVLAKGDTFHLQVTLDGDYSRVTPPRLATCTSSDSNVVKVVAVLEPTPACRVSAVAIGNSTITATLNLGQSGTASLSVEQVVTLRLPFIAPAVSRLAIGDSVRLIAGYPSPSPDATVTTRFMSQQPAIARVDSTTGMVHAMGEGTTTVTARISTTGPGRTPTTEIVGATVQVVKR
jgi:uncharacterized protein YjdB